MMNGDRNNQPIMNKKSFVCPHCKVLAKQDWRNIKNILEIISSRVVHFYLQYRSNVSSSAQNIIEAFCDNLTRNMSSSIPKNLISSDFTFAVCQNCSETTVWLQEIMIYPRSLPFPEPNKDMNNDIKELYLEAAKIFQDSPRASAALLRSCVEKLCQQLGEKGSLNTCVGSLVRRGLSTQIQQALDYCRVIGNSALHPGKIDIGENPDTVPILFDLVNDIAQEMLTKPREMNEKYLSLPQEKREEIEKRDKN